MSIVAVVTMTVLFAIAGSLAIWAYVSYVKAHDDVQGQIDVAVANGKKAQADEDEAKFTQRDKEPNRLFVGPNDYGRVTFSYPKTWSVYEATDVSKGGDYAAYLNPVVVPTVQNGQLFALRVSIVEKETDQVLSGYRKLVDKGDLKTGAFSANGHDGTRFDGQIDKTTRGSLVVFKIRDKTLIVQTDSQTFQTDFDAVTKTINFNQ